MNESETTTTMPLHGVMEAPEVYIDGYRGVVVGQGVAKLNCFTSVMSGVNGEVALQCNLRLVMAVTTLVQVRDALDQLIRGMESDGTIVVDKGEGDASH